MMPTMANHPNRGRRVLRPGVTPTPQEIRDARATAGLSQSNAAAKIHATLRAWQGWEADEGTPDHRRMHAGLFELFMVKTGQWQLSYTALQDVGPNGSVV
jgi:putative transcriptional regulator